MGEGAKRVRAGKLGRDLFVFFAGRRAVVEKLALQELQIHEARWKSPRCGLIAILFRQETGGEKEKEAKNRKVYAILIPHLKSRS